MEALLLQYLSLGLLLVWWQNFWVSLVSIWLMTFAFVWVLSKEEEVTDFGLRLLLNSWTLTVLHYALNRPEIRLYPGLRRWKK